ncbi:MAG: hypothetical protein Q4C95_10090 [Planctomycetia bacterium]|nr:hypothetical protein [Planctomycetia bacterium]
MKILKMGIFSFFFLILFSGTTIRGQLSTDRIFPEATKGFFAISDVNELEQKWGETQLAQLISDSAFDDFRVSLRTQLENAWTTRFGMKLSDLLTLPSGEIGGGLIALPGRKPGFALVMDITGNQEAVNQFLIKLSRKISSSKKGEVKKERFVIDKKAVDATVFVFPPSDDCPVVRSAYYINLGTILVVCDQQYLAELLLTRLAGKTQNSLCDVPAYLATIERCLENGNETSPLVRYFICPLEFGEAVRSISNLSQEERNKISPFNALAKQGFSGIQGVGGILNFACDNYETIWQTKVYIPEPSQLSLKMLSFFNVDELSPPIWIDHQASCCSFLTLDVLTFFNNFGPVFDEFLETEGAWNDILDSLEKDKNGPQVNLRTELIAHFGSYFSRMTFFPENARETGGKVVFALDIKPGKDQAVAETLHRMFDTDPEFKQISFGDDVLWQYVPLKKQRRSTRINSNQVPRPNVASQPVSDEETILKNGVFCVSSGFLFVANDAEYLGQLIKNADEGKIQPITNNEQYQKIKDIIQQNTKEVGHFIEGYSNNSEGIRVNYELYRSGKISEGTLLSSRILRMLLKSPDQLPTEEIDVDPTQLPPFEQIQHHLGIGGYYGTVEEDGFFFKGFSLRKQ